MTLKTLCSRAALAAVLAVSLAPTLSQADALDDERPVSITVSVKDLDLHTAAGAQELLTRVSAAAESACGVEARFDALRQAKFWRCYRETIANTVRQVNRPVVTQAYLARWPSDASKSGLNEPSFAAN